MSGAPQHALSQQQPTRGSVVPLSQGPTKPGVSAGAGAGSGSGAGAGGSSGGVRQRVVRTGVFAATATSAAPSAGGAARATDGWGNPLQRFLDWHDLTPRRLRPARDGAEEKRDAERCRGRGEKGNLLVAHAVYAGTMALTLMGVPHLVLRCNPALALCWPLFDLPIKEEDEVHVALFGTLCSSSFMLSGGNWPNTKNCLDQVIIARFVLAATAFAIGFALRTGTNATLLLGAGELVAGLALLQAEHTAVDQLAAAAAAREGSPGDVRGPSDRAQAQAGARATLDKEA